MLRRFKCHNSWPLKCLIIMALVTAVQPINGRKVKLIPLTAPKVDPLSEGRTIRQGLAAASGFALGLQNSLAGVFLYEVITADISEPTPAPPMYTKQEICFSSRERRSLADAEAIAEAYSRLDERDDDYPPQVRKSAQRRPLWPMRNNKRQLIKRKRNSHRRLRPKEDAEKYWRQNVEDPVAVPSEEVGANEIQAGTTGAAADVGEEDDVTCILVEKLKQ